MRTGVKGTFVIGWQQTEIDGENNPAMSAVRDGATWRWSGVSVRVDGPDMVIPLGDSNGKLELRHRAARSVKRLLADEIDTSIAAKHWDDAEPLFDKGFVLTDGEATFPATFVEVAKGQVPLIMFTNGMPQKDRDLWVVRTLGDDAPVHRTNDFGGGVICFTSGTTVLTKDGPKLVQDVQEGDMVQTKDNGLQEVVWLGARRMTGARFYAMPELRPIRIKAGALGDDEPDDDLLVSPQHRMLIKGSVAQSLFNTDEVLVSAEHLVNDKSIFVDYSVKETAYHHIMFENHQIVWANGVESESYHPANTTLDTLDPYERERLLGKFPDLQHDPYSYGAHARRDLFKSEAAILHHAINYRR